MTEPERIELIINILEGGNGSEFGRKIGVSKSTVTQMRKGARRIRFHINSILAAYPRIDREWLTTGEGHPGDISVDIVKARYEEKIAKADKIIDYLMKRIDELENQLQDTSKR